MTLYPSDLYFLINGIHLVAWPNPQSIAAINTTLPIIRLKYNRINFNACNEISQDRYKVTMLIFASQWVKIN
jgi:hypothetical protein